MELFMTTYLTRIARGLMMPVLLTGILLSYSAFSFADDHSFPEAKVKAALIYNFMRFIDWPEESDMTGVICVVGPRHKYRQALEFLTTRQIKDKNITVQEIHNGKGADLLNNCQIVFMTRSATNKQKMDLISSDLSSILIVGEDANFTEYGAMINLIKQNQKVGFEVNLANAKQANFRISSKVLRLADRVVQ
jgi:hypothetical protein